MEYCAAASIKCLTLQDKANGEILAGRYYTVADLEFDGQRGGQLAEQW